MERGGRWQPRKLGPSPVVQRNGAVGFGRIPIYFSGTTTKQGVVGLHISGGLFAQAQKERRSDFVLLLTRRTFPAFT